MRHVLYSHSGKLVKFKKVREAIAVALSVLCSNLQLYTSFGNNNSHEGGSSSTDMKTAGWEQHLVKHASEMVTRIQSVSASEALEISTDKVSKNGMSSDHSQDDIKWMETLFHFIISSWKSGRSLMLLDVIVELLYPVISLQLRGRGRGRWR